MSPTQRVWACIFLAFSLQHQLHAEVVYSNLDTFTGTRTVALDVHTIWDDITPTRGGILSEVTFLVQAGNQSNRFEGTLELREFVSGRGDILGPLIGEVDFFVPFNFESLRTYLITLNELSDLGIVIPDETFAIGISSIDAGWRYLTYGPPTVGATSDSRWFYQGSNLLLELAGSYAWEVGVIPEPTSMIMVTTAMIVLGSAGRFIRTGSRVR